MKGLDLNFDDIGLAEVPGNVHLARTIPHLVQKFTIVPRSYISRQKQKNAIKERERRSLLRGRARGPLGYARLCERLSPRALYCFGASESDQAKMYWVNRNPFSYDQLWYADDDPHRHLMLKLRISFSYYGSSGGTKDWNTAVRVLHSLHNLDFGNSDLVCTLDHTPGVDETGYSEYSKTYLDGIFALLVHHKEKHVMTIGFSVAGGDRVLINQIQLVKKKGNRFLYELGEPYPDFILRAILRAFAGFKVYLVDGEILGTKILGLYEMWMREHRQEFRALYSLAKTGDNNVMRAIREVVREYRSRKAKLIILRSEVLERIRELYGDNFKSFRVDRSEAYIGNRLTFYRVQQL